MAIKRFLSHISFIIILLAASFSAFPSDGYRIEVHIAGLQDSTTFLAYHFGERQFLKDTAQADKQGRFVFEGNDKLDRGMYMVVLPGSIYFEIIVDANQHFSIATSLNDVVGNLRFTGSPENKAFYDYIGFLKEAGQKASELRKNLDNQDLSSDDKQAVNDQITAIDKEIQTAQNSYIADFPDNLFSKILLAQKNPDISDIPEDELNDPANANRAYQLYKHRFWDNVDFSDDRLLRTPIYHTLLTRYFNQFLIQVPDTIITYIDQLIEKSRANKDVFRYTLWFAANNYERSQIMGMDAVFVHVVDKYYTNGEAFWMTEEALQRIKKRADVLRPILIGKKAPDINGFKPDGQRLALHDVEAEYLLVYFWESDCGHCQRETPILKKTYEAYKQYGIEVFALNVESDAEKWKKAVERYETTWININDPFNRSGFRENYDVYAIPMIFLLDKDKKIIAKKISADQLDGFMKFQLETKAGR